LISFNPATTHFDFMFCFKRDRVQNGTQEFRFGVEMKTECKVKGQHKRIVVTSTGRGHLLVKSELPLGNGAKCSLVETLRYLDGDLMHQVGEDTIHILLVPHVIVCVATGAGCPQREGCLDCTKFCHNQPIFHKNGAHS
jgi:hypothetical protein